MVDSSSLLQHHCCSVWLTFTQSRKNQLCFCRLNVWCSAALLSPEKTNWMEKDETALMKQLVISTHQNSFRKPTLIPGVNMKSNGHSLTLHCHWSSKGRCSKLTRVEEVWTEVSSSSRCCLLLHLLLTARFFMRHLNFEEIYFWRMNSLFEKHFVAILESLMFLHTHARRERWWCLSYVDNSSRSSRHAEPYETTHTHTVKWCFLRGWRWTEGLSSCVLIHQTCICIINHWTTWWR